MSGGPADPDGGDGGDDVSPPAELVPMTRPYPDPSHTADRAPSPSGSVRPAPRVPARRPRPGPAVVRVAPSVARVAAVSAWNVLSWSAGATIAGANYVARRAADGEAPTAILQDAVTDLRKLAWRALGLPDSDVPRPADVPARGDDIVSAAESADDLQRRGEDLLRRSNDVHVVPDTHPAFARILGEITPDEARILRFLYLDGPQPAIDIRTHRPLGIGSVLIAGGMSMIAEHAGLRTVDRIHPYLTNLARLGLIDFSKEQVSNPTRYQVIEAQPKVAAAMKTAGRSPRIVQRSIRLNDFGTEFVRTCLPLGPSVLPHRPRPDQDS